MLIRHCDKCRKELNNETDKDSFVLRGQNIDLCPSCASSILAIIKNSSNSNISIKDENTNNNVPIENKHIVKRDFEINVDRRTITREDDKKTIEKVNATKETSTKEELSKQIAKIVALYNETAEQEREKREERKARGKQTKLDRIHEYGIEKFAREYLDGTPSSYFEELLGVTKFDIAGFVRKYKIYKTNRSHKQSKEGD